MVFGLLWDIPTRSPTSPVPISSLTPSLKSQLNRVGPQRQRRGSGSSVLGRSSVFKMGSEGRLSGGGNPARAKGSHPQGSRLQGPADSGIIKTSTVNFEMKVTCFGFW